MKTISRKYQICKECVMDTSDSQIVFDEDGVCDFCNDYKKNILSSWTPNMERFDELEKQAKIIRRRGKNKKHDCIIGLSGGVDSSYLCYVAKEIMHLRPLVYICNTGWNLPVADKNIERVTTKLGLDVYEEVINWDEMRDLQIAFFKSNVPYQDYPQDLAIFAGLYNYAVKHKIKYVLTGANNATESIRPPLEWNYVNDVTLLRDIHRKYGNVKLETFPQCSILKYKVWYRYFKGMKRFAPLDYVKYNKKDIDNFLVDYFGYEKYKNKHYEDIFTRWYEGYYLPTKFGFDKRRCYFSNLIHIGEMTRDQALKELANPPYDETLIKTDAEYIANKLGLSLEEFKKIVNVDGEKKSFHDYKNSYWIIKLGIRVMRFLGMEKRNFR